MANLKINAEPDIQEITISYSFDAPRDLVFRAHVEPELLAQWVGPRRLRTVVDKMDARSGGEWRYVQHSPEGDEYAFHGVFHEITAPERIVQTFEFEGVPGHVVLETKTFEEANGRTTIHTQSVFQSVADRDGMLQAGMETGVTQSEERLTELLAKLRAG